MKITPVIAIPEHLRSASMLFPNVDRNELDAAQEAMPEWFGSTSDDIRFGLNAFLVQTEDKNVLIDTGMPEGTPGLCFDASLEKTGLTHDDIDVVIFTHRDIDHVGGCVHNDSPKFPSARHFVPRTEYGFFRADEGRREVFEKSFGILEQHKLLEIVEDNSEVLPGFRLWLTPGHTAGTSNVVIRDSAIIMADIWHSPVQIRFQNWAIKFDWNPAMAVRSRQEVIEASRANNWLVGAPHVPGGGLGRITNRWVPATT